MRRFLPLSFIGCVVQVLACGSSTDVGPEPGSSPPSSQMCTREAKMCPDGSSVGRTGTHCEFPACPPAGGRAAPTATGPICEDQCGDGTCAEIVCLAIGCPCVESKASCPKDCH